MTKNAKKLKFNAALKIATNFGANTNYKICDIPDVAYGTQYGFAVSQDTGKALIIYVMSGESTLYVQSKGATVSTGDWLWCNIDILCTS